MTDTNKDLVKERSGRTGRMWIGRTPKCSSLMLDIIEEKGRPYDSRSPRVDKNRSILLWRKRDHHPGGALETEMLWGAGLPYRRVEVGDYERAFSPIR